MKNGLLMVFNRHVYIVIVQRERGKKIAIDKAVLISVGHILPSHIDPN